MDNKLIKAAVFTAAVAEAGFPASAMAKAAIPLKQ